MNEYLLGMVGTVLFASVLQAIMPNGKSSELIKSILRTACLVVILSPIVRFFVEWKEGEGIFVESGIQRNENFIQYCREQRIEEAESFIETDLENRYSLDCDVSLKWELKDVAYGKYTEKEVFVEKIEIYTQKALAGALEQEI